MSIDLSRNFLRLLLHFRRQDLVDFTQEHQQLYEKAGEVRDYGPVTQHYYSVMAPLIDEYFNGNFHFVPPLGPNQAKSTRHKRGGAKRTSTLEESLHALHLRIGDCLELGKGTHCVDVGCGLGSVIQDIASTGANLTGITLGKKEAEMGNERFKLLGIDKTCRIVEADCKDMSVLESSTQDRAYAIYALKYIPQLASVLSEVVRVLKPGGRFVIYDLMRTDSYDPTNEQHRCLLERIVYSSGMPPLYGRDELIAAARKNHLELADTINLCEETGFPFFFCFVHSALFMWMIRSSLVKKLIGFGESVRILPKGFSEFNRLFLSGMVDAIVRAGELGIISGAEIMVFQKAA